MSKKLSLVLILMLFVLTACQSVTAIISDPYKEQINLGYKFIEEGNYEEAILAFNKAIEINIKRDEAYLGLAETYAERGDENTVNDVNDILAEGYRQSNSKNIISQYIKLADKLIQYGMSEWANLLLQLGYEVTGNEQIKNKIDELIELNTLEYMKNLYMLCEGDNLDKVKEVVGIISEDFRRVAEFVTYEKPLIYSSEGDMGNVNGKGVGIYRIKSNNGNFNTIEYKFFIYYGDYENNQRNGEGTLFETNGIDRIFYGNWDQDKPNGYGETKTTGIIGYCDTAVVSGTLVDGLWDGKITEVDYKNGEEVYSWPYNFNKGIVDVVKRINEFNVIISTVGEAGYSISEEEVKLTYGVEGFADAFLH